LSRVPARTSVWVVLVKLAAVALVLGIVPAALWAAGDLPVPQAREDLVPSLSSPELSPENEWRQRVGAICGWQRKQTKTLGKAFRKVVTPADLELLLENAIRLGERSEAIFRRLHPPLTYRREARTLRRLFHRENTALRRFADAMETQNRGAFLHGLQEVARVDARIGQTFTQLGIDECRTKPLAVPDEGRAPIV
jgi:hypothetical protein